MMENIDISLPTTHDPNSPNVLHTARKFPQYIAGMAATLGALAAGTVLGWTSSAGANGVNLAKEYSLEITPNEFSWIGSIVTIGGATICIPIGILADLIGRRRSMLVLVLPFTLGWVLIIWSKSVAMFIVGRYIVGASGGAFCITAPMYTAEIAESSIRGSLGSYFQLMLVIGILLAYILGAELTIFGQSLVSAAIPLVFFIVFFFMPETPTFYLKKGRIDEARESYRRLRGLHYNFMPELELQIEVLAQRNQTSLLAAICSKAAIKGLFIGFGLMFVQQLSGVNAIIFYASSIFNAADSTVPASLSAIIVGAIQVIAVFISTLIVDRLGRRLLLLMSSVFMCLTTLVLGIYFFLEHTGNYVETISWIPLTSVCIFITMFSIGFGPIPWTMLGEIFSTRAKGIASSSVGVFNWLMAFLVTKCYSMAETALGTHFTFLIFSLVCAVGVAFVFFIVPETKGKTLEEIQIELRGQTRPQVRDE